MAGYEYRVVQLPAGGSVTHLNERMSHMIVEGWEPIMMSGNEVVNILLRRPLQQKPAQSDKQQES